MTKKKNGQISWKINPCTSEGRNRPAGSWLEESRITISTAPRGCSDSSCTRVPRSRSVLPSPLAKATGSAALLCHAGSRAVPTYVSLPAPILIALKGHGFAGVWEQAYQEDGLEIEAQHQHSCIRAPALPQTSSITLGKPLHLPCSSAKTEPPHSRPRHGSPSVPAHISVGRERDARASQPTVVSSCTNSEHQKCPSPQPSPLQSCSAERPLSNGRESDALSSFLPVPRKKTEDLPSRKI